MFYDAVNKVFEELNSLSPEEFNNELNKYYIPEIGDLVSVKSIDNIVYKGVIFGMHPVYNTAQVHWIDDGCPYGVHWSKQYLTIVRRCPLVDYKNE